MQVPEFEKKQDWDGKGSRRKEKKRKERKRKEKVRRRDGWQLVLTLPKNRCVTMADLDPDIAGDLPSHVPAPTLGPRRRPRPPPAPTTMGPLRTFLVVGCVGGLWCREFRGDATAPPPPGMSVITGIVLTRWAWLGPDDPSLAERAPFVEALRRGTQARGFFGFIDYPVVAAARLRNIVPVAAGATLQAMLAAVGHTPVSLLRGGGGGDGGEEECSFQDLLNRWFREHGVLVRSIVPVLLALPLAMQVMGGRTSLHMVAVTARLHRKSLLVQGEPSRRKLKTLCAAQGAAQSVLRAPRESMDNRCLQLMHDPAVVLEWLSATSYIRNIRQAYSASMAFARIFARRLEVPVTELTGAVSPISYETLRWARVKADVVAMALHRRFCRHVLDRSEIFIWCDASPQWRGAELFATTFEIMDEEGNFHRRLAPVLSLQRSQLDTTGKMVALLWQIWLMAGPKMADFLRFLNRVRGVCTDMGTERLLANHCDFSVDFFRMFCPRYEHRFEEERAFAFPRAVQSPGWRHLWDVVLRRGLASLSWFPAFMSGLRAVVSFFRTTTVMSQVTQSLTTAGFAVVADMLKNMKLPAIADWRWEGLKHSAVCFCWFPIGRRLHCGTSVPR